MFKNIGSKIKGLAKFIFWVMSIIAVLAGIGVIIAGFKSGNTESNEKIYSILIGIGIGVGGIILAWVQNFLLYGFGELVDSNQKILRELEQRSIDQIVANQRNFPQQ